MSSKRQISDDKGRAKQRSPNPAAENLSSIAPQQPHPAAALQRAGRHPRSLAPGDVLQLQRTIGNRAVRRLLSPPGQGQSPQKKENKTGLPHGLKTGVEILSGVPMDDVTVHYDSPVPSRLRALAYTRGTEIHLGPRQEQHLPHEAWHVVQQKQGRVKPTMQLKGADVNDDVALEHEADVMGAKALQMQSLGQSEPPAGAAAVAPRGGAATRGRLTGAPVPVVQGVFDWAINAMHNYRKVGVEITENNTGGNNLIELAPDNTPWAVANPPWAAPWTPALSPGEKSCPASGSPRTRPAPGPRRPRRPCPLRLI